MSSESSNNQLSVSVSCQVDDVIIEISDTSLKQAGIPDDSSGQCVEFGFIERTL